MSDNKQLAHGDVCEIAIWLSGTETPEQIEHFKTVVCPEVVKDAEKTCNVEIGPLEFETKFPGEDRVPPVPDEIQGPDVRLLIASGAVVKAKDKPIKGSFAYDLRHEDLMKLRKITRREYAKHWPGIPLNDKQVDQIIDSMGPAVAMKALNIAMN